MGFSTCTLEAPESPDWGQTPTPLDHLCCLLLLIGATGSAKRKLLLTCLWHIRTIKLFCLHNQQDLLKRSNDMFWSFKSASRLTSLAPFLIVHRSCSMTIVFELMQLLWFCFYRWCSIKTNKSSYMYGKELPLGCFLFVGNVCVGFCTCMC